VLIFSSLKKLNEYYLNFFMNLFIIKTLILSAVVLEGYPL